MTPKQQKKIDYDGTDVMSRVITNLVNQFPGMKGVTFEFAGVTETSGFGIYPTAGAAIESEKQDVLGHVRQRCQYPFTLVYRSAFSNEGQRIKAKEFLDTLARWLERQPVTIDGTTHQLATYPEMTSESRKIKSITRTSPAHFGGNYDDKVEDWVISLSLKYDHEFDR